METKIDFGIILESILCFMTGYLFHFKLPLGKSLAFFTAIFFTAVIFDPFIARKLKKEKRLGKILNVPSTLRSSFLLNGFVVFWAFVALFI